MDTNSERQSSDEVIEKRLLLLERELAEMKDREAILEGIHRYCQAVDRCDLDMLKSRNHCGI